MQNDQWRAYEESVEKHQRENPSALRLAVFNLIRRQSALRPAPGANVNTYTLYFQKPDGRPVVLGHQPLIPNLFLAAPDATRLMDAGIAVDAEMPAVTVDEKSRTSGLNVKAAFGKETAWRFKLDSIETTKRIFEALNLLATDTIPPDVLARWIGRLRHFFPNFSRFSEPDADFDEHERTYKLQAAAKLRADIATAQSDIDYLNAVYTACANSKMLQPDAYGPISPDDNANIAAIAPAFKALVTAAANPEAHPQAVMDFATAWVQHVSNAHSDSACQIAGLILMFLSPETAVYLSRSLLEASYLEAVGQNFPRSVAAASLVDFPHQLEMRPSGTSYSKDATFYGYIFFATDKDLPPRRQPGEDGADELAFVRANPAGVRYEDFITAKSARTGKLLLQKHIAWDIVHGNARLELAPTSNYPTEVEFATRVRDAFAAAGLAPRDLIDVQGALSVVFNYKEEDRMADPVNENRPVTSGPLNLILYGPPGTGKTYATAFEAVRLCIGDDVAAPLRNNRDALMTAYRELLDQGRIEFVTFHQSFSYEDFVEGLRPSTEPDDNDGENVPVGAGFSLKPHDGVFKRICNRANLGASSAASRRSGVEIDTSKGVFKMSLGDTSKADGDRIFSECIRDGKILMGYDLNIDWSNEVYCDPEEILARTQQVAGRENTSKNSGWVSFTDTFRNSLQVGSIILVSRGLSYLRAVGVVTGDYFFDSQRSTDFRNGRSVKWLWSSRDLSTDIEVSRFYQNEFSRQTLYEMKKPIDWIVLTRLIEGNAAGPTLGQDQASQFVLLIDEINRANISKVFGELITLLEIDKRLGCQNEIRLRLPYSGTSFGVPSNLHIIGTMNTADRSIALLDTALRRRFTFRELMPDPSLLDENVDGINLRMLLTALNDRVEYLFDREHQIGHAYFTGCRSRADIEEVMRHKVIPLLSEYFYDDWSKVAAVLGDRPFAAKMHFLEAKRLEAPAGLLDDELGEEKVRWSVKMAFDFSEFEPQ